MCKGVLTFFQLVAKVVGLDNELELVRPSVVELASAPLLGMMIDLIVKVSEMLFNSSMEAIIPDSCAFLDSSSQSF